MMSTLRRTAAVTVAAIQLTISVVASAASRIASWPNGTLCLASRTSRIISQQVLYLPAAPSVS